MQRFVVIYYDGDENKAKLIDDDAGRFPFGVDADMVGDDCVDIHAIIAIADDTTVPLVVIDDQEVALDEPTHP